MIRYVRRSWFSQLYRWRGGSLQKIWIQTLAYCIYCVAIFLQRQKNAIVADTPGSLKLLGSFATFSLVFTLNQCYSRYIQGVNLTAELFSTLMSMNHLACCYAGAAQGGLESLSPEQLRLTVATQVHVARLTLAIAVAFALHRYTVESAVTGKAITDDCHVAILFQLTRLRGLLLEPEVPLVDASTGLLVARATPDSETRRCGGRCCVCGCSGSCCCAGGTPMRLWVNFRFHSGLLCPELSPLFPPHEGRVESSSRANCMRQVSGESIDSQEDGFGAWQVMGTSLMLPLAQLLRHHIAAATCKPWGFPERFLNLFEGNLQHVTRVIDGLEELVSMPLPMAYLQQRKMLFLAFIFVYPMTLPNADGWWTNVITPSLIFMAMAGFESVAEMLENPLGDDSEDLNIDEMLHDFEVRVSKALGIAEERMGRLQEASQELLEQMPLPGDSPKAMPSEHVDELRRLSRSWGFDAHFVWRPVPPQVLVRSMAQMHASGQEADEEMRRTVLRETEGKNDSDSDISMEGNHVGFAKYTRMQKMRSELYRAVSVMRGRDAVCRQDLLGVDHFLCLRARAGTVECLLEEFGREFVRETKSKGAGSRLLSRLYELWRVQRRPHDKMDAL
mmetsp:Transcript_140489/g.436857  ORF Transcript_140489/g.436857 Transcript_140489/m.436857 type:complete len:617 (+) Transcript_140489:3-1853(+)